MAFVEWSEDLSVGVPKLDRQHQQLVALVNELHDGMKAGKGKDVLGPILARLVDYTKQHFRSEEDLFESYDYPKRVLHKGKHDELTAQVGEFQKKFESGAAMLSPQLMAFLKMWLVEHIQGADREYRAYFESKGVQ